MNTFGWTEIQIKYLSNKNSKVKNILINQRKLIK